MAGRRDSRLRHGLGEHLHPVRWRRRRIRHRLPHRLHSMEPATAMPSSSWQGNDEMEPAKGDGWAELQNDGSLEGEICLLNGDNVPFTARRSKISSTAC